MCTEYPAAMPELSTLTIFVGAAMLLFIVPGPAVLYVVTRSLSQGRNAGLVSVGGIHAGSLVHILAAMLGLSALVATSTLAFSIVKWAGAAYLVYLGIRTLLADDDALLPGTAEPSSYRKIFTQGVIVNVLNPKTAIFFVAFVPQFIDPSKGSATLQILVLGIAFIFAGTISDGIYAVLAGTIGDRMSRRPLWRRNSRYASGAIYLLLGAAAAASGTSRQ
jgi:threonine/homoserine/homoserine lactone efflux protein